MGERVSIIVPIYKVEPYIRRAVNSILQQTYRELEIILVDDGSPDNCGKICDEYQAKDKRIKVIHKENGGLSDARNAGLDIATGDYIAFVDSDDYVAPDFIEKLLDVIHKNQADVAICSFGITEALDYDDTIFEVDEAGKKRYEADGSIEICTRRELLSNLYDANHRDATYFIVVWNKLYKAGLWKDIRFPKGKIHEDEATTYRIYDMIEKGVFLHQPLYGYFSAPESITRGRFKLNRLDWLDALTDRIRFFEEREEWEQVQYARRARTDGAIKYFYPVKEELSESKEVEKRLRNYVKEEIKEKRSGLPLKTRIGYRIFLFSPSLYRKLTCINMPKGERAYQIAFVLLFLWLAFLCFYKLDVKYVDPWDESRHGVNAYEMLKEGHLIESTYLYETDYYNLKPPLSMWSIMLSMIIFGKTVFAMRFPSVLFYLILALAAAGFLKKRYGRSAALLCLAFLSANTTPFLAHMVRAGDADSLYTLLFTLAMLCMMNIRKNQKNLYACGLLFALAFLTKSFHAGVIVVIGGLYLLFTGELKRMKPLVWLKFIASAMLPIGIWAGLRYMVDGTLFFRKMWATDVVGRSGAGFGSNEAGFGYYFSYYLGNMSGSLQIYLLALLAILLLGGFYLEYRGWDKEKKAKILLKETIFHRDVIGFALWVLIPTLAFSAVATKLLWYLYPAITALLIGAAALLGKMIQDKKLPELFREAVWGGCLITAGVYSLILTITFYGYGQAGKQVNDFQLLIQEIGNVNVNAGMPAYVVLETDQPEEPYSTDWAQQDVFVAEAYGDYLCRPGGLDALLCDVKEDSRMDRGILFTNTDYYEKKVLSGLEDRGLMPQIIGRRGQYLAVMIVR
ncbi:MAG: glycosyltransferase [Lachnospiraceae bacterium]|nr:glycosyltransferase [Lachnospiraceae bacterium]